MFIARCRARSRLPVHSLGESRQLGVAIQSWVEPCVGRLGCGPLVAPSALGLPSIGQRRGPAFL